MTATDREELWHLFQFIREFDVKRPFTISESPDLRFDKGGYRIGVEHTRLIRENKGKNLRRVENVMSDAAKEAQDLFSKTCSQGINVRVSADRHVLNDENVSIGQRDQHSIATAILEVVRRRKPHLGCIECIEKFPYESQEGKPFPIGVSEIWIDRLQDWKDPYWLFDAMDIKPLEPKHVKKCLDNKEGKVFRYLKNCDKVWLLMVMPYPELSGSWQWETFPFETYQFSSSFDRLLLMDAFSGKTFDLRVKKQSRPGGCLLYPLSWRKSESSNPR